MGSKFTIPIFNLAMCFVSCMLMFHVSKHLCQPHTSVSLSLDKPCVVLDEHVVVVLQGHCLLNTNLPSPSLVLVEGIRLKGNSAVLGSCQFITATAAQRGQAGAEPSLDIKCKNIYKGFKLYLNQVSLSL